MYPFWIIAALFIPHLLHTETPGKTRKINTQATMRMYKHQDLKTAEQHLEAQQSYNSPKDLTKAAQECLNGPLSLSLLTQLAASRPECTTTFHPSMVQEHGVLRLLEDMVACVKEDLQCDARWIGGKTPYNNSFFNTSHYSNFKPFMEKKIVPPGSTIFVWGDTHGCIQSLLRTLNRLRGQGYIDDNFKIKQPNTYFIYLGDCVDRGYYGLEVLYTLMRLKAANPQQVILVRGNHEDSYINRNADEPRFHEELHYKQFRHRTRLYRLYDMMVPVLYLGSGSDENRAYLMCCHGGLEIGCLAAPLINALDDVTYMPIETLNRADRIKELPTHLKEAIRYTIPEYSRNNITVKNPHIDHIGYLWSQFIIEDAKEVVRYLPDSGWKFGQELTRCLLDRDGGADCRVRSLLRAHQHAGRMQQCIAANKGCCSMWDGMVRTLISAPAIELSPACPYDSIVKITTAATWENWEFEHLSHLIPS